MTGPVNVREFESLARARMDATAFDYYAGGAGDERTVEANCRAFDRLVFRPRVLAGVEHVDTGTTVLGTRVRAPVLLAPTAFNRLGHADGELAVARAAAAHDTILCCSTIASQTIETVATAGGPLWFQLYVYRDRSVTTDLVRRAEAAGCRALVLTVDTPRLGRRERDVRNQFTLPADVVIANLERYVALEATRWSGGSSFTDYVHRQLDPSLTWEAVSWLRSVTTLPILIKGILAADDAERAVAHGASGLVVSNHGGRQLDGSIATIDALPAIVARVAGRIPVLLDGGIRRGTDILRALALGAAAVLIGRPYLWGLAAAGEDGVRQVLAMFESELELAMALAGCASIGAIAPALVERV